MGSLAAVLISSPALAQGSGGYEAGDIQLKVVGTLVAPDGGIEEVVTDAVGLPADTDTAANDNFVPTIAIEYFVSENFSIETIAGTTQHDVDAVSGLPAGTEVVSNALLLPATFTAKAHFDFGGVKPYVGAGGAYFIWLKDSEGAGIAPLGATDADLSNELGFVVQAGIDIPVNDSGLGLTFDAKRYFIDTTLQVRAGDTLVLETDHKLDPWVVSAGVSYRF